MAIMPPILRQGDTIGIVSLGSPLSSNTIAARVNTLRGMGFEVVFGQYVFGNLGLVSATKEQRAYDLMNMFADKDVKMILPVRGGVGVADILPYLDYRMIRENPKIVTGYSDITVLLNVLAQRSRLITFQSLMLIDFRPTTPAYNFEQFFTATSTVTAPRLIQNPPGMPQISKVQGNVTGPIVGGNLTSFVDTLGTAFEIDTRGTILLLEETHEPANHVYRMLEHLWLAGKLDDCLGIVMGECTNCEVSYRTSYDDLINDVLVPLGKPLMTNVATAHGLYKAAIPIGARVNLNTFTNSLTVLEPTVAP
ncbi:LD-carboxypeptidase [Brevibacillus sp. B_LB10_24]|uniref:S66 peptidase family protein n=1 Tax=Brevibacillus sp. B_LB10_24 TaxID=3380645 RepID=UPI0038BCF69E